MDVRHLQQIDGEDKRRYLIVAINKATRWVCVAVKKNKAAARSLHGS